MAAEIKQRESDRLLARVWLNALEETARDFHGHRPKSFCQRAYEHATYAWLKITNADLGIETERSNSIRGALDSYIETGVKAGLFQKREQFQIVEMGPDRAEITITQCPYRESCLDLLAEGFALSDLTCARLGCFRAAVLFLAGIDCYYRVLQIGVEADCHGIIERL